MSSSVPPWGPPPLQYPTLSLAAWAHALPAAQPSQLPVALNAPPPYYPPMELMPAPLGPVAMHPDLPVYSVWAASSFVVSDHNGIPTYQGLPAPPECTSHTPAMYAAQLAANGSSNGGSNGHGDGQFNAFLNGNRTGNSTPNSNGSRNGNNGGNGNNGNGSHPLHLQPHQHYSGMYAPHGPQPVATTQPLFGGNSGNP
eukprot:TRINITY_DN106724_c0_g1_i1.p1 TRINITY_DN106724_c0_g1~~TRINITY_DN106724_c0_g1_i1.p1  ORF type:complete len:198 (-),score=9.47 TRINITY_DN106724_c0_g1_i1:376-969(-)